MLTPGSDTWKILEGGYRRPYDASIPLKKLGEPLDEKELNTILDELWDELHHQGDVGLASYLSLPYLVEFAIKNQTVSWKIIGLCGLIEQQRHEPTNPILPQEYTQWYLRAIDELRKHLQSQLDREMNEDDYRIVIATLVTCSGKIQLGKAISNLDPDILKEFLENF